MHDDISPDFCDNLGWNISATAATGTAAATTAATAAGIGAAVVGAAALGYSAYSASQGFNNVL